MATQAFADSISNYTVSNQAPLNQNLTIYGVYSGSPSADVLCAFYIFDLKNLDVNKAVIRLSDQYTFSDGSFYAEYLLSEPLFRRGIDYNAVTKCGTIEIGKKFTVAQKEDILFGITPNSLMNEFRFWVDPNNSLISFFFLFVLLILMVTLVSLFSGVFG
jgi:hypothetical protein